MNKLYQTVKYCKQFENIPRHDRYEKGCKNCPHTDLCDILPCMPADIDLLKLGVLYREQCKSIDVEELREDYKTSVELVKRFEKDAEKLGRIKDIILNKNYDLPNERLNDIAKIVGDQC